MTDRDAPLRARARATGAALAAALLAALLIAGCGGSDAGPSSGSNAPLKVGLLLSLTGGGNVYGPQQLKAARLALAGINAQGGIEGRPLRLVVADDTSDPAAGRRTMRELIEDRGVTMVIGPTLSLVAIAADPVANRLRTPVLAVSNTAEGIVGRCAHPCEWIWRDSLGEATAVPANIEAFLLAHRTRSAAILQTPHDVLGADEATIATHSFRAGGVRVAAPIPLPQGEPVAAAVQAALAAHPDAIFLATTYGDLAADVMREARAAGFDGAFLGGSTFNSASTGRAAGAAGAGALSGSAWYEGNDFPANARFVAAYRRAYGEAPDQFAAQAYTGVQIAAQALTRAGIAHSDAPLARQRADIQQALGDVALMSPLGPFRFTSDHDVEQIVWVRAMDGRGGTRLAGFCNPSCSG